MEPYTDTTPMPWGKHKGTPMSEVPDDYLLRLWENLQDSSNSARNKPLFDYIEDNLDSIKQNAAKR